MVDIHDVPCLSCQKGWNSPHICDEPDYCACMQAGFHRLGKSND